MTIIFGISKELSDDVAEAQRLKGLDFDRVFISTPDIIFYKNGVEVHRHRVTSLGSYA